MEYKQIGYTLKTHGVSGELKVFVEEPYEELFLEKDRVFLEIKGRKQPFFLENIRGGGALIVKFEDVRNREEALTLQSKALFLPASEIPEILIAESPSGDFAGLRGYMLIDQSAGAIGTVEEVLEMPQQEMAVVQYQGKELLIPLNKQFVRSVDAKAREVLLDLPEGLLTL